MAWLSYHACIRSKVSIDTPKAFSILSAIYGDRAAFSFTRSDNVARRDHGAGTFLTAIPTDAVCKIGMVSVEPRGEFWGHHTGSGTQRH